jgi:hypothetical protein
MRRTPSSGSQGCSQAWMGTASVRGSHASTAAISFGSTLESCSANEPRECIVNARCTCHDWSAAHEKGGANGGRQHGRERLQAEKQRLRVARFPLVHDGAAQRRQRRLREQAREGVICSRDISKDCFVHCSRKQERLSAVPFCALSVQTTRRKACAPEVLSSSGRQASSCLTPCAGASSGDQPAKSSASGCSECASATSASR